MRVSEPRHQWAQVLQLTLADVVHLRAYPRPRARARARARLCACAYVYRYCSVLALVEAKSTLVARTCVKLLLETGMRAVVAGRRMQSANDD